MTVDKREQITLPVWVISGLVSIVLAGFTTWGVISAKAATLDVRATHNEINIETLRKEKVSRDELTLVLDKLNGIEKKQDAMDKKLDDYIQSK
jgi:lipopolysaccharide export LptBFGC system permease protein LptF